jgi:hypothetical protein
MTIGERCPYSKKLNLHNLLDTPSTLNFLTSSQTVFIFYKNTKMLKILSFKGGGLKTRKRKKDNPKFLKE